MAGVLFGSILRAILEYTLPKDGFLVIPYGSYSYDYGPGQVLYLHSIISPFPGLASLDQVGKVMSN